MTTGILRRKHIVLRLDFTKAEHHKILNDAGLNGRQRSIYLRLRDDYPYERQSIVKIADEMHLSTATVSREIKKIQMKIIKLIK